MHNILNLFAAFSPEQWAMIAGLALSSPFAQYVVVEYSKRLATRPKLKENLNWLLSIAFPALGTVATILVTTPQVSKAFPILGVLYMAGQGVYLASIRFIKKAKHYEQLYNKAVSPERL